MRKINVIAIAQGSTPEAAYMRLADFEAYQVHSDVVRKVVILEKDDARSVSEWEVNFRQGILRWKEEDHYDPVKLQMRFEQLEGDAEEFRGEWSFSSVEGGTRIEFNAEFDMGIPSMNDIIEPIAELALRENIQAIISGLIHGSVMFPQPVRD